MTDFSEDDRRRHHHRDRRRSPSRSRSPRRHEKRARHSEAHSHDRGYPNHEYRDSRRHAHTRDHRDRNPSPDRRRPERSAGSRAHVSDDPPAVGSIHHATVVNVRPFGLFVELMGFRRNGLVHNSQISEDVVFSREDDDESKVQAMEYFAPKGSKVWVKVSQVQDDGGPPKVSCSMKHVSQEDGADLDPQNTMGPRRGGHPGFQGPASETPPEVGSVLEAIVATVKPFGLFVRLKGYRANGLVHLSQVSDHLDIGRDESDEAKVESLSSIHAVGDPLFVKIVDVSEEPGQKMKVACSIKLVDQREGTDLDPSNTKYQPRGEGPQGGRRGPVTADAAVAKGDTVEWGHLAAGDQRYSDGKQYELLGDEVLTALPPPPPPSVPAGGGDLPQHTPPPAEIGSVEEALAILLKHKQGHKRKDKKAKKSKEKDKKKKKSKKERRAATDSSSHESA